MKKYIPLFSIQLCSALSTALFSVALIGIIFNNAGSVSLLMICMALPAIFFSRAIGNLLDKHSKKPLFIIALSFELVLISIMLAGGLFAHNHFVYIFAFLTSAVNIFIDLLLQISVTELAKEKNYLKLNSTLSLIENIGVIIGPIVGGYLIYQNNIPISFAVIFALYALMFMFTALLKISKLNIPAARADEDPKPDDAKAASPKPKLYLRKIYLTVALFGFAISIINVTQISFVISHYNTNELGFGLTESAWGIGMSVGAFILLILNKRLKQNFIFGLSFLVIGMATLALVVNLSFQTSLFLFLLIGMGNIIIAIVSTTFIQQIASSDGLGKSLGMKSAVFQASCIAAMAITGFADWTVPAPPTLLFVASGIIFLLGSILALLFFRKADALKN